MARRNRNYGYRRYRRNYYRPYTSYGRRYGSGRAYTRRSYRPRPRYNKTKGFGVPGLKVYPSASYGLGFVAGLTNIDRLVPPKVLLTLSALPLGGKWGKVVTDSCRGAVFGEVVSDVTGFKVNFPTTTKNKSTLESIYA